MKFIRTRRVSIVTAYIGLVLTANVFAGWIFDIPTLRSIIPSLPQMIPMTALMVALLSMSLLLIANSAEAPLSSRSKIAAVICGFTMIAGLYSLSLHLFQFQTALVLSLFRERVLAAQGVLHAGTMSTQTAMATFLLSASMLIFRKPGKHRSFYIFEVFLIAAAALCLFAIIGYVHDANMAGPLKFIGMSLPSAIGFCLLSVGVLFLKIDEGIVKSLRSRDGAGLFLRLYLPFSILFPLFSSAFIHWGESEGYYPVVFSKTVFVIVIISSLVILGIFMARAIRKIESQRLTMEQAEAKAALEESEESLRRTKERLELALSASSMGTWETDLNTGIVTFSDMARKITHIGDRDISSEEFFSRVHPDDLEEAKKARRAALEDGALLDSSFRYIWPDGTVRWFRSQGRAKYDRSGNPVQLNGTIVDITEEKSYQKRLEVAVKEAESASSLKSTFLANMSHEIRTPLGAILGFAEVLNDPSLPQEERSRYVQIIQRNGETLSHILNDILDLSKVESGHLDIEKIRFSIRSLLGEIRSLLEVRAKDKNLFLNLEFAKDMNDVMISDPVRLKQILINLVGNALKFTKEGGVTVSVRTQENQVVFEIIDTGVGIDREKQEKLFKPFSQADSSITRIFGGTGLGLVLSRRLAELLGGYIELKKSELGKGSTFVVFVENFQQPDLRVVEKHTSAVSTSEKPLKDYLILLTEDSPDIQKLLTLLLRKEGAQVDLAINGADCLQKYSQRDYDLILMDIQMPIMDGYSASRKLREIGFKKPIIALTAHAMSDEHQRCIEAGCDGYLSKPIQKQKLVDLIVEVTEA